MQAQTTQFLRERKRNTGIVFYSMSKRQVWVHIINGHNDIVFLSRIGSGLIIILPPLQYNIIYNYYCTCDDTDHHSCDG